MIKIFLSVYIVVVNISVSHHIPPLLLSVINFLIFTTVKLREGPVEGISLLLESNLPVSVTRDVITVWEFFVY